MAALEFLRQAAVEQQSATLERRDAGFLQRIIGQALGMVGIAAIQRGTCFGDKCVSGGPGMDRHCRQDQRQSRKKDRSCQGHVLPNH